MTDRVTIAVSDRFQFEATPEMCAAELASISLLNGEIDEPEYTSRILATRKREDG